MNITDRIIFQNSHWGSGEIAALTEKRHLFTNLWQDIDIHPMGFLTGSRRTGKSVLLKQLAHALLNKKQIPARQIVFFEFAPGDAKETIWSVFRYFQTEVRNSQAPSYLFFDEIQFAKDYESVIKEIYDNEPNTKIFLTGSLSLSYKKKMAESLGGRFFSYKLFPLSFPEYLEIGNFPEISLYQKLSVNRVDKFERSEILDRLNAQFREFVAGGRLPEMLFLSNDQKKSYLESVMGQTLTQDSFNYFTIEKPQTIIALFNYFRINSGGIVSIQSLSKNTGANSATVSKYLDILELMGLIYSVYNGLNPFAKLNSSRKIYVNSAFSLLETKLDFKTAMGIAAESYILERLLERKEAVTFFRKRQWEVDFLLPERKIAYEVKFRSEIHKLPKAPPKYTLVTLSQRDENPVCTF